MGCHLPYFKVKLHIDCMGQFASISAMLPTMGRPGGPGIGSSSISATRKRQCSEKIKNLE